jgi:hypothetical protein
LEKAAVGCGHVEASGEEVRQRHGKEVGCIRRNRQMGLAENGVLGYADEERKDKGKYI